MIEGGCFCGEVRYTITDKKYPTGNCHCSMCSRVSAARVVPWMTLPKDSFSYIKGQPKTLKSSPTGQRYFCADCGTPIACTHTEHPGEIGITVYSLDAPDQLLPISINYFTNSSD
ncbi:MAG: GFA family protein [Pseudomonadales bacterium]|nr:GFA family protein [Pseudomonadales bacterium]